MRRLFVVLAMLALAGLLAAPRLRALSDDDAKAAFLKARANANAGGDSGEATPHPRKHGSPSPSPHHRKHPAAAGATPRKHRAAKPEETPRPRRAATPFPRETPSPSPARPGPSPTPPIITYPEQAPPMHAAGPGEARTPYPAALPVPPAARAIPQPTPAPTPAPQVYEAPINIQKEGLEQQGTLVPPPAPEEHHHWWNIFSHREPEHYRYLTKAIRDAIDRAPVARHRWRYIVVHNSGTRQGNAKIFDYYHRYVRKMPNGLAYHFVIGNGSSSGNGQIEIGNRWIRQINGGHVHSDFLNNISLGICLVGDFNRDLPTQAQLDALDELIRYLRVRVGKIDRQDAIVKAHKEINPVPTDCPGDRFPYRWLHAKFG